MMPRRLTTQKRNWIRHWWPVLVGGVVLLVFSLKAVGWLTFG